MLPCFLRIDIVRCGHALALDTHFSTLPLLIHPSFRVQCRPSPLSVDIFPLYLNPLLASWKVRQCKAHFLPLFSWCDFCRAGPLRCKPTRPCRHSSRCGSRTLTSPPSPFTTLPFLSRTHSVGGVSLAFQYLPPSPLHLSFIPLHTIISLVSPYPDVCTFLLLYSMLSDVSRRLRCASCTCL